MNVGDIYIAKYKETYSATILITQVFDDHIYYSALDGTMFNGCIGSFKLKNLFALYELNERLTNEYIIKSIIE